jgi:hypothetical protein
MRFHPVSGGSKPHPEFCPGFLSLPPRYQLVARRTKAKGRQKSRSETTSIALTGLL